MGQEWEKGCHGIANNKLPQSASEDLKDQHSVVLVDRDCRELLYLVNTGNPTKLGTMLDAVGSSGMQ